MVLKLRFDYIIATGFAPFIWPSCIYLVLQTVNLNICVMHETQFLNSNASNQSSSITLMYFVLQTVNSSICVMYKTQFLNSNASNQSCSKTLPCILSSKLLTRAFGLCNRHNFHTVMLPICQFLQSLYIFPAICLFEPSQEKKPFATIFPINLAKKASFSVLQSLHGSLKALQEGEIPQQSCCHSVKFSDPRLFCRTNC